MGSRVPVTTLLSINAAASQTGTAPVERACVRWSAGIPAKALVSALILASLLLSACGEKKPKHAKLPPPPPITTPSSSKPAQSAHNVPPQVPSEGGDSFSADAPAIWTQTGLASWYGPPYHNRQAANGDIFDMHAMTAAHKTLPMNSLVRVTNLKTSATAVVRINDRGPFIGDRIIDLSEAAAKATDVWRQGLAQVRVDVLMAPVPIESGGRWCVQVGAFTEQHDALKLKEKLLRRYGSANVIQFKGPTGYWVRIRPLNDDKDRAEEVANWINVNEGGVFLVRLD
jgi:rare lipoprotein A